MKRLVTTLVLTIVVCCVYATDSDGDLACSPAPSIDLTRALITRSTEKDGSIIFNAALATGDTIRVKQEQIDQEIQQYSGDHFFTVSNKNGKEAYLSDEIFDPYAETLFNECAALHAQQEAKKKALEQAKGKRSTCSLQ